MYNLFKNKIKICIKNENLKSILIVNMLHKDDIFGENCHFCFQFLINLHLSTS